MTSCDQFGVPLTVHDGDALRQFDTAVARLLTFSGDPVADVDAAIARDPDMPMGHVLKGLLCVLGTEKSLLAEAQSSLAAGQRLASQATEREARHLDALGCWTDGRLYDAVGAWEEILVDQPDDALAMLAAHQGDFFLGQSTELRDRVARRLGSIDRGSRLAGYYHGMYAFGLEETGNYPAAEAAGRLAVESDPRDAWAIHAVAHVMEMTGRVEDGRSWLESRVEDWSRDNFFAVHNWWHLALFYFDQQRWSEVLDLYDRSIRGNDSTVILDMLDASSLLWRLTLHGVDVGDRWQRLAEAWAPRIDDAWYAFNDAHAMMAFVGAGRNDLAQRLLQVMIRTASSPTDNGMMTRTVALPVARAIHAYGEGRYDDSVELLLPVRGIAARAGGSHAQRDLIAQTLASAAEKSGRIRLARGLLNERIAAKPQSALNRAWSQRIGSA